MIFNNFTLRHTVIYLSGFICLVVLNIHQLHQFQLGAAIEDPVSLNNLYPESTFYKFIDDYGYCEVARLSNNTNERRHALYSIQESERPCTAQNYYLLGKGLLFLALIPIFLLLFPLFSGSNLNQRIYNRAFYISISIISLMVLNMFYELFYNLPPRDYVPRFNPVDLLTWSGLIVYLSFLLNGWGRHRENLLKFLLVTAILALPLTWVLIALLMFFTT